jgi:hypothetical protein
VAVKFPPQDHVFVYTATDEYTFAGGSFRINFEASCNLVSFDFETGDLVAACSGNWQLNGGSGGPIAVSRGPEPSPRPRR